MTITPRLRRAVLGAGLALLLAGPLAAGDRGGPRPLAPDERAFLERHWQRPIPAQGPPPGRFPPGERSLAPEHCGACHPVQWADWRESLHARSMGPGVAGQLVEMARSDPGSPGSCLVCHAPLAEQSAHRAGPEGLIPNPDFDPALQEQGVTCAVCHVRRHERFGPPRRDGSTASPAPRETLPHGGATRTTAFLRSEFCSSCHQFGPDGFTLNGTPLENTYEEWRRSPAARQGLACQDCHMPERRHRWRGIHDPEMVRGGVEITLGAERPRYRPGEVLRAALTISSVRVGHAFPTYVTPRVLVRVELVDPAGRLLPGSAEERVIGRQVPLDLSREIADTRIPAGGRFRLEYRRRLDRPGLVLRAAVTVYPDHFYTAFFESLLAQGAGAGEGQIRQALAATRRSAFVIFHRDLPLTGSAATR